MKSTEIKNSFLEFFKSKGHQIVRQASVVRTNDPSLLFTNAGMNQFKEYFLNAGKYKSILQSLTTCQTCLRAGGKHNDLENVGYTTRHHTLFEMLGNFSFGEYFKKEAIHYAWEFLTDVLHLPKDKLYVTVYITDKESYRIWHDEIKIPSSHIVLIGDKINGSSDNFWQMGEVGLCGPCTEIFYDYGSQYLGGLPGTLDEDGPRYTEIWNIVFMEYNRQEDKSLLKLKEPCVDTGMGLERITAVVQGVQDNYKGDLIQEYSNVLIREWPFLENDETAIKVITDHMRSIEALLQEGIMPSNTQHGYVLRKLIRRALRFGYKNGVREPFLYIKSFERSVVYDEEVAFLKVLKKGINFLDKEFKNNDYLSGDVAFKLSDTYGFPLDIILDICKENGVTVDVNGFNSCLEAQRLRSKK